MGHDNHIDQDQLYDDEDPRDRDILFWRCPVCRASGVTDESTEYLYCDNCGWNDEPEGPDELVAPNGR